MLTGAWSWCCAGLCFLTAPAAGVQTVWKASDGFEDATAAVLRSTSVNRLFAMALRLLHVIGTSNATLKPWLEQLPTADDLCNALYFGAEEKACLKSA